MLKIKDFLGIGEAAAFLGVANNTLKSWERNKRIPTYKAPGSDRRLYKREDLENYLKSITER